MQEFSIVRKKREWGLLNVFRVPSVPNFFAMFFGLLPVLAVPFVPLDAEYTKSLLLILGSLAALLVFSFAVLRKQVVKISVSTSVFLLWCIFLAALVYAYQANASLDAYLTPSFGVQGILMLGLLALLAVVPLMVFTEKGHITLFFQVLGGGVITLAGAGVLASVYNVSPSVVGVQVYDFVPAAAALLVGACLYVRTASLTPTEYVFCALVCLGALVVLVLGGAPTLLWGIVAALVALLFMSEGSTLLRVKYFHAVTASLLKKRARAHHALALLGIVASISTVSFLAPEKIAPYALQGREAGAQASLSYEVSKELLIEAFAQGRPYLGVGFDGQLPAGAQHLLSSFAFTTIFQFGVVGLSLFVIFLCSYVAMGVRALYFPLRYEREVYVSMRAVFVTGGLLWIFALSAPAAQSSLYLAAFLTGIVVLLSRKLHPSSLLEVDVLVRGKHRRFVPVLTVLCVLATLGGMYLVWQHGSAARLMSTAADSSNALTPEDRLERMQHAYAQAPHREYLRTQATVAIAQYRTYIETVDANTPSEEVLAETKRVTSVVAAAQVLLPKDVMVQQTAFGFFALLAQMGVDGAAGRAAGIADALASLVPSEEVAYRLKQMHYLVESKEYDKALAVADMHLAQTTSSPLLSLKSYLYAERGDFVHAAELLRAYIVKEGATLETQLALAVYVGHAEGVQAAVFILEEARALEPRREDAYAYLAIAYTALANPDAARVTLEQGVMQVPKSEFLHKLLDEINGSGTITSATIWDAVPLAVASSTATVATTSQKIILE